MQSPPYFLVYPTRPLPPTFARRSSVFNNRLRSSPFLFSNWPFWDNILLIRVIVTKVSLFSVERTRKVSYSFEHEFIFLLNISSLQISTFSENGKISQKLNKVKKNETKRSFKISSFKGYVEWNKIVRGCECEPIPRPISMQKWGMALDRWISWSRNAQSSKIIFFLETIVLEFAPSEIGSLNKDRLGRTGTFSRAASMEGQIERVFSKILQIFPKRVSFFPLN